MPTWCEKLWDCGNHFPSKTEDRPGSRPARQPPVGTNSPIADAIFAAIDKPLSRPLQQRPAKPMLLTRRITTNRLTTAATRRLSTTTAHKTPRPRMLSGFPTAAPAAPSKPLRYADVRPPFSPNLPLHSSPDPHSPTAPDP